MLQMLRMLGQRAAAAAAGAGAGAAGAAGAAAASAAAAAAADGGTERENEDGGRGQNNLETRRTLLSPIRHAAAAESEERRARSGEQRAESGEWRSGEGEKQGARGEGARGRGSDNSGGQQISPVLRLEVALHRPARKHQIRFFGRAAVRRGKPQSCVSGQRRPDLSPKFELPNAVTVGPAAPGAVYLPSSRATGPTSANVG